MTALAGAGRCDPSLIEAARGGDTEALVSLIAAAQPDIRRYAARNVPTRRYSSNSVS